MATTEDLKVRISCQVKTRAALGRAIERTEQADLELALAKAGYGIELTPRHKRLVATELARRAYLADLDHPTCGADWAILRDIAACGDMADAFADLVSAFADWQDCQDDVESWRHRSDVVDTEPMSSEGAFEYVETRLADAVDALVGA